MKRLPKRESFEIENGGFGKGKLRDLYLDYDLEDSEEEKEDKKDSKVKTSSDNLHKPENLKVCYIITHRQNNF